VNDTLVQLVSYVGFLFGGYCGAVGAYVVLRWGAAGVGWLWSRRAAIDEDVENDFKYKIGR